MGHIHSKRTRENEKGCIYCSLQKMIPALRIQSIIEVDFVIPIVNEIRMKQWTHRRASEHTITNAHEWVGILRLLFSVHCQMNCSVTIVLFPFVQFDDLLIIMKHVQDYIIPIEEHHDRAFLHSTKQLRLSTRYLLPSTVIKTNEWYSSWNC